MNSTGRIRILIVDDNPDYRELIAAEFRLAGFSVSLAENPANALALVKSSESDFDAIISDFLMPLSNESTHHFTGIELFDALAHLYRELGRELPLTLLLTGFSDMLPDDAHQHGASAIFTKPVGRQVLVRYVCEKLGISTKSDDHTSQF